MQPTTHRLLIADDEEAIRFAMKEYFEGLGYDADCAREKQQARALLDTNSYAVVIADLRLGPGETADGLELVGIAKRRSPSTRTLILTAYGSREIEAEARRLGVDVFLHKPERRSVVGRDGFPT
jgi:DNA-binding response OmpR family regulator